MAWSNRRTSSFRDLSGGFRRTSLGTNRECFIRKGLDCGKLFAASKSCFIACPTPASTDDPLHSVLELISEKLTKVAVEPIIAIRERAYGQDIFCTKICGKIIEARFCIVILDDSVRDAGNFPNPNVYYEYGLMTALRKHIIPLQKRDLTLAFNIQSHDTIKYTNGNLSGELDIAIRDAIRITDDSSEDQQVRSSSERTILRGLELAGFETPDRDFGLADVVEDTSFLAFQNSGRGICAYVGKVDQQAEVQSYLEDLAILVYRTEKRANELSARMTDRTEELAKRTAEIALRNSKYAEMASEFDASFLSRFGEDYKCEELKSGIASGKRRMSLISRVFVGFIVSPTVDREDLVKKAEATLAPWPRYVLAFSENDVLNFPEQPPLLGT